MPRELVTIQVGQCGNQVAAQFWELALREHAIYNKSGIFDDSLSSFFRNVDTRYSDPLDLGVGQPISTLRARAVVVDMEEGVINSMLRSEIGDIFDSRQFISDVSGCGNNWSVGFYDYGRRYEEQLMDKIRKTVEQCESIQSFFLMHSMGGGTGSGVGTFILTMLHDMYPEVFRFNTVVFPEDDVVTGPYNSMLAMYQLTEHSDCVLPVDNRALFDILNKIENSKNKKNKEVKEDITDNKQNKQASFHKMNNIIAHMLNNLTCSMRFEGQLNVDLNEITMNLVPFPKMSYLVSSISPLYSILDVKIDSRRLDQIFSDVIHKDFQLLKVDPKQGTYMACGLILRGDAKISDINRNVQRIRPEMNIIHWNQEGFKVGLCSQSPVGMPYSLLCLSNQSCIKHHFNDLKQQFLRIFRRKAHVHHYTEYMDIGQFSDALHSLEDLVEAYESIERTAHTPPRPRIKPVV